MSSFSTIQCDVADGESLQVEVTGPVSVVGRPEIVHTSKIQIEGPARVTFEREQPQELRLTILMATLYGVFYFLERLSLSFYIRRAIVARFSRWASAQFMDCYVIGWLIIELTLYNVAYNLSLSVILAVAVYRLTELSQAYTNIVVFHRLRHDSATLGPYRIVSHWRTFVIGVINLMEGGLLFGLILFVAAKSGVGATAGISSTWDALYLSFVTITTLGYGDIQPSGLSRGLAAAEAVWGLLFGIALLGRFVAVLPADRALDDSGA